MQGSGQGVSGLASAVMVRGTCCLRPAGCSEAAASGHLRDPSQGAQHTFSRTHTKRGRGLCPGSQLAQWVGPRTPHPAPSDLLSRASGSPPAVIQKPGPEFEFLNAVFENCNRSMPSKYVCDDIKIIA